MPPKRFNMESTVTSTSPVACIRPWRLTSPRPPRASWSETSAPLLTFPAGDGLPVHVRQITFLPFSLIIWRKPCLHMLHSLGWRGSQRLPTAREVALPMPRGPRIRGRSPCAHTPQGPGAVQEVPGGARQGGRGEQGLDPERNEAGCPEIECMLSTGADILGMSTSKDEINRGKGTT